MSEPLVTVALPVYNGEAHLATAIDAIRRQTYRNLEILISDNASADRTQEIALAAAAEDPRIRYFRHDRNLGPQANFHHGLSERRGEYFMWAAHDDEKAPEFVAEAVAALQRHPTASMACSWTTVVSRDHERVHRPYSPAIASDRLEERLQAFVADTQCVAFYGLYRSSVLARIGPPDNWLDADRHYLFKAIIAGPFEVVPRALFRFRMFNSLDDYVRMGLKLRPGATDYDLDLYHYIPHLMREAGVDAATIRRSRAAMMVPMRPYFENRATFLIGQLLASGEPRQTKLSRLFAWARQYPPLLRARLFWGAVRRTLVR
jgi:glycosyltransferase involved in cell wall biosynthesis